MPEVDTRSSVVAFTTNLQAVRLIAAYLVLSRHSLFLLEDKLPFDVGGVPSVGIWIFFTVSGYLLTSTWAKNPRIWDYSRARFRRIFPQFGVVIVLTALLLGPLLSYLTPQEYFTHPTTWGYFYNLLLRPSYFLPGVFAENHYVNAVNGSLWSMPPQILTYALVPVIFLLRKRLLRIVSWGIVVGVTLWDTYFAVFEGAVIWGNSVSQVVAVIAFFAIGALLRELRVSFKPPLALGFLIALIVGYVTLPYARLPLMMLTVPYIVMTISLRSWPILREFNKFPDISYGVFLVGFPVQQAIVHLAPSYGFWGSLGIALVISTVLAVLLERFVERPILKRSRARRSARQNLSSATN